MIKLRLFKNFFFCLNKHQGKRIKETFIWLALRGHWPRGDPEGACHAQGAQDALSLRGSCFHHDVPPAVHYKPQVSASRSCCLPRVAQAAAPTLRHGNLHLPTSSVFGWRLRIRSVQTLLEGIAAESVV
jgi:hypothetical protein